jgi:hypothetical protein
MFALLAQNRLPEARAFGERILRISDDFISQSTAIYGIGKSGDVARARAVTAGLASHAGQWRVHTALMRAYLGVSDTARALTEMERALAAGEPFALSMSLAAPIYDPVRGSPRFRAAVERLGLDARFTAPDGGRSQR